ncbi:MAG: Cys-tRNA(Pro) deacylase [Oscillospiraceae bacterium]|nr:Cys-tRNA(Pro) deacylase [Oscillospiraceae bacterium]
MSKELKTNAMRMLDKLKIPYDYQTYECENFEDGVQVAKLLGQSPDITFKTLVTVGKSAKYYVFVLPVNLEMDLKKCAKAVGEKSLDTIHVKDIQNVTGYIRGGCSPIGMKKPFRTVIHESAKDLESIIVSGGRIGLQLKLTPDNLIKACSGEFADIAAN